MCRNFMLRNNFILVVISVVRGLSELHLCRGSCRRRCYPLGIYTLQRSFVFFISNLFGLKRL
ncbi:hypothetical protein KC19_4G026600 [Ceratodon purpureus]|uniref:Uncharacterized protein n=1 Tax=Ceratodon purpureus TaxID=3225 RepID=A0A8T0I5U2_CERPU|nr:hypothetical protein KC19_4G026600 [Ceratodon purpureus]